MCACVLLILLLVAMRRGWVTTLAVLNDLYRAIRVLVPPQPRKYLPNPRGLSGSSACDDCRRPLSRYLVP